LGSRSRRLREQIQMGCGTQANQQKGDEVQVFPKPTHSTHLQQVYLRRASSQESGAAVHIVTVEFVATRLAK
jgi:hypothetical protein